MTLSNHLQKLAVCSWSLRPGNPEQLAGDLETIGIKRVQLALDPIREDPATWGDCIAVLRSHGIEIASGMMTSVGEDYSTLETIRVTGGITPDGAWDRNLANFTANAEIMKTNGVSTALFHAGFLPHDQDDPEFARMLGRLATVAGVFDERGLGVVLETGQEPASGLLAILRKLDRPNVRANFDPANMILYNTGNPIEALRTLGSHVGSVHIKDANVTKVPGTWGEEVVVGTGQVDWREFFRALSEIGFSGDLCIEREACDTRVADIVTARDHLQNLAV